MTAAEMKATVAKSWEEFHLLEHDDEIDVKMDPTVEKKPLLTRLLPLSSRSLRQPSSMRKHRPPRRGHTPMNWDAFI